MGTAGAADAVTHAAMPCRPCPPPVQFELDGVVSTAQITKAAPTLTWNKTGLSSGVWAGRKSLAGRQLAHHLCTGSNPCPAQTSLRPVHLLIGSLQQTRNPARRSPHPDHHPCDRTSLRRRLAHRHQH